VRIVFAPEAQADVDELYDWIADRAGEATAQRFIVRIRERCERLDQFPERGTRRDDLAPGLRTFGVDRRVTVACKVLPDVVVIVRLLYAGRNVDAILREDAS
jgi:toxin ParE1/3/4